MVFATCTLFLGGVCLAEQVGHKPPDASRPSTAQIDLLVDGLTRDALKYHGLQAEHEKAFRARAEEIVSKVVGDSELLRWTVSQASADKAPQDALWFSTNQLEALSDRLLNDVCQLYKFDERQRAVFSQRNTPVFADFMARHRSTLEPLISEILIQKASGEPPSAEKVAEWSTKFLPVYKDLRAEGESGYRAMMPHLRPDQRKEWRKAYFVFNLGATMAEAKLRSFSEGRFDPREWNTAIPGPHLGPERVLQDAQKAGLATQPTGPAGPMRLGQDTGGASGGVAPADLSYLKLDKWQSYVRHFAAKYRLDEGQLTTAMSILKEMRQRAELYLKRRDGEFRRLKDELSASKGEKQARTQAELAALQQPLAKMFEEFRARLDSLLTESQSRQGRSGSGG